MAQHEENGQPASAGVPVLAIMGLACFTSAAVFGNMRHAGAGVLVLVAAGIFRWLTTSSAVPNGRARLNGPWVRYVAASLTVLAAAAAALAIL